MSPNLIKMLTIKIRNTSFDPMTPTYMIYFHIILHLIEPTFYRNSRSGFLKFRNFAGVRGPPIPTIIILFIFSCIWSI